ETVAGGTYGIADGVGAAAQFQEPAALALDGAGHLFVADPSAGTVRQIVLATGAVTTPYGEAGKMETHDGIGALAHFSGPAGLAYDGGSLYVSDRMDHVIRQINLTTGYVALFAGTAGKPGNDDGLGVATFFRPGDLIADGR